MVVPALAALLAYATVQVLWDQRPLLGPIGHDELKDSPVFLSCPGTLHVEWLAFPTRSLLRHDSACPFLSWLCWLYFGVVLFTIIGLRRSYHVAALLLRVLWTIPCCSSLFAMMFHRLTFCHKKLWFVWFRLFKCKLKFKWSMEYTSWLYSNFSTDSIKLSLN